MKTLTKTKPCYYCSITIDIENDDFIRIDTIQSVLGKGQKAYAHELCDAQANDEADQDRAIDEYLDDQERYAGPTYYEELFDGEY